MALDSMKRRKKKLGKSTKTWTEFDEHQARFYEKMADDHLHRQRSPRTAAQKCADAKQMKKLLKQMGIKASQKEIDAANNIDGLQSTRKNSGRHSMPTTKKKQDPRMRKLMTAVRDANNAIAKVDNGNRGACERAAMKTLEAHFYAGRIGTKRAIHEARSLGEDYLDACVVPAE